MSKLLIKTSVITFGIAASLALTNTTSIALASSEEDLQNKKLNILENRSKVQDGLEQAEEELDNIKTEQDKINDEIKRLDMLITETNSKIRENDENIKNANIKIQKLNEEIKTLKERIKQREELLKERARSYQEIGTINYLDVLIGSQSFSDFLDRAGAVTTIITADQDLIQQHMDDKKVLEDKENEAKDLLVKLENYGESQKKLKSELDIQKKNKDDIMQSLKDKEEDLENEKLSLEEQNSLLDSQEEAIEKAIKIESEKKTQVATKKENEANSTSSSIKANTNVSKKTKGVWTTPAQGRLTSTLGERWNKFHAGIDIANSADVPIVAAANGVVSRSYYSTSYGNVVFISHSINGQVYTTVYAHMDSRVVKTGESVSKGQQVGIMGNTGQSFGQHLHFELHKGQWNASKSNAVNPLDYISI
ncbi:murein hydrolase activator EnvC family protein [Niallia taxi]|uniref:murein hydrolase activator EnvC family protein n=1 Tax=Niallia taxi TaxID=2499688 RepID=UPI002E246C2E|nr:peptidoglycan DD-metalloendopeptidase family protein [Niallia taxi]